MSLAKKNKVLLDAARAAFIQDRVSVNIASRDAHSVPSVSRAYGCRVAPDRCQVTVFLSAPGAGAVLDDIRRHGAIAVAFSRPTTHETLQLKGTDARVEALRDGDVAIIEKYKAMLRDEIHSIGYSEAFVAALAGNAIPEFVAVSFTPSAAFDQTPGPHAGQKVGA